MKATCITKEDEQAQRRREPAKQRACGEKHNANHVVAFAAENAAQPRRKRKHDGIGYEITGQHPGAFVHADSKSPRNVRQGDVGEAVSSSSMNMASVTVMAMTQGLIGGR